MNISLQELKELNRRIDELGKDFENIMKCYEKYEKIDQLMMFLNEEVKYCVSYDGGTWNLKKYEKQTKEQYLLYSEKDKGFRYFQGDINDLQVYHNCLENKPLIMFFDNLKNAKSFFEEKVRDEIEYILKEYIAEYYKRELESYFEVILKWDLNIDIENIKNRMQVKLKAQIEGKREELRTQIEELEKKLH